MGRMGEIGRKDLWSYLPRAMADRDQLNPDYSGIKLPSGGPADSGIGGGGAGSGAGGAAGSGAGAGASCRAGG